MAFDIAGLSCVVTGSGRGIGRGIATRFASAGANVLIATRSQKAGEETADLIRAANGKADLFTVDLSTREASERTIARCAEKFGGVDIVIHNAGVFPIHPLNELDDDILENTLAINLKSAFWLAQASHKHLKKSGRGRLLFTSSVTGPRTAIPGLSHYGASKAGLNGFIKTAALEYATDGITVNGVEPGLIKTDALDIFGEETSQKLAANIPMKALGEVNDIANTMLFLASAEAKYITGQTIIVDGGSLLVENASF
jgi:3-oxoacyl-[acyl-carrier protein] reductase